jgi:hypothetical protein
MDLNGKNDFSNISLKAVSVLGLRKRRNAIANIKELELEWNRKRVNSQDTLEKFLKEYKTTQ